MDVTPPQLRMLRLMVGNQDIISLVIFSDIRIKRRNFILFVNKSCHFRLYTSVTDGVTVSNHDSIVRCIINKNPRFLWTVDVFDIITCQ